MLKAIIYKYSFKFIFFIFILFNSPSLEGKSIIAINTKVNISPNIVSEKIFF